jgi:hypothetical protein
MDIYHENAVSCVDFEGGGWKGKVMGGSRAIRRWRR